MKWCLPAFGTSLVVFLLLFTAIDLRQSETQPYGSMIEPRPGDTVSADSASERSGLAGREWGDGSEPVPTVSTLTPPEESRESNEVHRVEEEPRSMPAAVALVFEQRLEDEFLKPLRERRTSWFDRRKFSRAAPRVEELDFTRIEVPREAAHRADAAVLVRRTVSRGEAESRLILLRVGGVEAPFEIASGVAGKDWGGGEEFVQGFPSTLSTLPIAPKETKRRRAVGPTYERLHVEQIDTPLTERATDLELTSLLSRMYPSDASFTFRTVDDTRLWPAAVDGLIELTASGAEEGAIVQMPVRYHVDSGEMQVKFAGEWHAASEVIAKIRARRFLIPSEDGNSQQFGARLGVEWMIDS